MARAWDTIDVGIMLFSIVLLFLLGSGTTQLFQEEQLPAARLAVIILIYALVLVLLSVLNRRRGMTWGKGFGMGPGQLHLLRYSPVLYLA
ncbi:MAG TPA: hypothetical protein VLL07_01770, partial [Pontiella sp.]|nr:hypothetical protein [Pontiella sp.]